jgi:hypothetical protein
MGIVWECFANMDLLGRGEFVRLREEVNQPPRKLKVAESARPLPTEGAKLNHILKVAESAGPLSKGGATLN